MQMAQKLAEETGVKRNGTGESEGDTEEFLQQMENA